MSRSIKILLTFLEMNAKEFKRDKVSAFFTLLFPLFFLLIFGLSAGFRSSIKFAMGVSDLDSSRESKQLVKALAGRGFVSTVASSKEQGIGQLKQNKLGALLIIPPNSMGRGDVSSLELYTAPGQRELSVTILDASLRDASTNANAYHVVEGAKRQMSDFTYIFPGLLAMALLQLGLFATATPLLRTRDRGSLRHLSLTPVPKSILLISQILLRLGVAVVQIALLLAAGHYLFQVPVPADALLLCVTLALGAVMLIAAGYAVAGSAPSQDTGMLLIMLVNFAMLFFGQIFFDFSSIPGLGQLTRLIPVTYLADACRQQILGIPGMFSIRFDLLMIAVWTLIAGFIAIRTFRFDMEAR